MENWKAVQAYFLDCCTYVLQGVGMYRSRMSSPTAHMYTVHLNEAFMDTIGSIRLQHGEDSVRVQLGPLKSHSYACCTCVQWGYCLPPSSQAFLTPCCTHLKLPRNLPERDLDVRKAILESFPSTCYFSVLRMVLCVKE